MVDLVATELDRVDERIAGQFALGARPSVRKYASGLVAGLERKNSQVATARRRLIVLIARSTGSSPTAAAAAGLGRFGSGDALSAARSVVLGRPAPCGRMR
jgi:hypothetical protein